MTRDLSIRKWALTIAPFCILAFSLIACSSSTGPEPCSGIEYPGGVCLDLSAAEALTPYHEVIEEEVGETLEAIGPLLEVTDLRIAVYTDLSGVIPEIGLGGFNPGKNEVRMFIDPTREDLETVLREEFLPILAHEIHHAIRRRSVGYGSTLFEAAVTEGLADHFSVEVAGGPAPIWSMALTAEDLDLWLPQVVSRTSGVYNHAEWFLGAGEIPRWVGYAVGFELVDQYLGRNPEALPSALIDTPAAAFLPPAD